MRSRPNLDLAVGGRTSPTLRDETASTRSRNPSDFVGETEWVKAREDNRSGAETPNIRGFV